MTVKYTLDQLLERKWDGWDMRDYLFLSVLGDIAFLRKFDQIQRSENYSGVRGMSICVVGSPKRPQEAYHECEKVIASGAENVGLWLLGAPIVREISFNGIRPKTEGEVFLTDEWRQIVRQLQEASQ